MGKFCICKCYISSFLILIGNLITHSNFVNCCLAVPLPTLGHYWGGSHSYLTLITVFCLCLNRRSSDPSNEVGSLSTTKLLLVSRYEEGSEVPPLKLGRPPIHVPLPVASSPLLVSQYYVWSAQTVLMTRIIHLAIRTVPEGHTYLSEISHTVKQKAKCK